LVTFDKCGKFSVYCSGNYAKKHITTWAKNCFQEITVIWDAIPVLSHTAACSHYCENLKSIAPAGLITPNEVLERSQVSFLELPDM
jgi:hypothetical protein